MIVLLVVKVSMWCLGRLLVTLCCVCLSMVLLCVATNMLVLSVVSLCVAVSLTLWSVLAISMTRLLRC